MKCFDSFNSFNHQINCPVTPDSFSIDMWIWIGLSLTFVLLLWIIWIYPIYNIWRSRKRGQADLAEEQFEQQIQIATAQGRYNAAELNKKAAIIEAEAVATQITTIGEHLKEHDLYLRWQWIEMMKHRDGETIYVPTEANLPVLEATRRLEATKLNEL